MIERVRCTECGKSNSMPVRFEFEYQTIQCGCCMRNERRSHTWYFCGIQCFHAWFDMVPGDGGVPCPACMTYHPGSQSIRSNGLMLGAGPEKCPVCDGSGRVKETRRFEKCEGMPPFPIEQGLI